MPEGQLTMDNLEKQVTQGITLEEKTQHSLCWTPLWANEHTRKNT